MLLYSASLHICFCSENVVRLFPTSQANAGKWGGHWRRCQYYRKYVGPLNNVWDCLQCLKYDYIVAIFIVTNGAWTPCCCCFHFCLVLEFFECKETDSDSSTSGSVSQPQQEWEVSWPIWAWHGQEPHTCTCACHVHEVPIVHSCTINYYRVSTLVHWISSEIQTLLVLLFIRIVHWVTMVSRLDPQLSEPHLSLLLITQC